MSGLVLIVFCELGVVERLHIVSHFSSLDCLLGQFTVAKVVAVGEVALVDLLGLFLMGNLKKGLANIILSLDLLVGESMTSDTEEPCVVYLLRPLAGWFHEPCRVVYFAGSLVFQYKWH